MGSQKFTDQLVEAMPWLDGTAEAMQQAFDPLVGGSAPRGLKDALVGTWLGHPLHPAVIAIPIGAWTSSLALDLAGEERAADLTLALGLGGAVAAAITGAAQWQDAATAKKPRRLGALHAGLNGVATLLYVGSLRKRRRGERRAGIALATAGYAIANASAWIGGDLAYDLGIGVDHTAFERPPRKWTDVAALAELEEGKPKRVEVNAVAIMLLRRGDEVVAISATCPHLAGPLDEGAIEGDTVTCPWHGSVFCLSDGRLLHGPATMPVPSYETRIEDGRVSVRARS